MPICGLGLGINLAQQVTTTASPPPPPPSLFSPSDLWLGSEVGGWWDFSDAATMRVARNGTGPAPVTGDPVGYVQDQGPNGLDLEAPSDSARPMAIDQNGTAGLRLDGIADYLRTVSKIPGPDMTVIATGTSLISTGLTDGLFSLSKASGTNGTYHLVSASSTGEFRARVRVNGLPGFVPQLGHLEGIFTVVWSSGAGTLTLRHNSTEIGLVSGYQGNLQTERMFFGSGRGGTTCLACDMGAVIQIGRVLTPTELADAEAWVAARKVQ